MAMILTYIIIIYIFSITIVHYKKIYFTIVNNFKYIFSPYWWCLNSYNKEWDKKLNYLLDNYKIESYDCYYIIINKYKIWVENYPYGAFVTKTYEGRPAKKTIEKAHKILLKYLKEKEQK